MKHSHWLEGLRTVGQWGRRSRRARSVPRARSRNFAFEPLEERLVFALQVNIALDALSENGGVATATVSRTGSLAQSLTVNLSSSDTTEATVPTSVVIGANQTSATLSVTAVNDTLLDDGVSVTITASAAGQGSAADSVTVLNDDFAVLGHWPAADVVNVSPGPSATREVTLEPAVLSGLGDSWHAEFAGREIYQTAGTGVSLQSDDFFPVDLTKTYALAGWAKSGDEFGQRFNAGNLQSFGFASYDVDLQPILAEHVLRFPGAMDTTLAAPLNPGDTTIHLTSASGWSNSAAASSATRGLAWYGYEDSQGTTYPEYTYTRNVALGGVNGLWAPGAVSGNVITLEAPWNGPALLAGTAVRNTGDGSDESFVVVDSESVPGDWTWSQHAGTFGGAIIQNGTDSATQFRPGTAFIKPVIVANEHGAADNFISWRDVTISEVATDTTVGELAQLVVDLSVITTGDQRHTLLLPQASPYSWASALVKVDTSERYTLATWAPNQSNVDERPLGFASFDADKKLIHPLHVTKHAFAADTTLAASLTPGATSILITNASGWSNEPWESAETRALAWYGYTDSTGHTYPNYSYTRNVAFDFDDGLWSAGAIRYDQEAGAYRIELNAPWNGPTLAAGTAVRNAASGAVFHLPEAAPALDPFRKWTEYEVTIGGGVWHDGQRDENAFRPGTTYVQPIFAGPEHSGEVIVGPEEDAIYGGPSNPNARQLQINAGQQIVLDLDVLAKSAFGGAAMVVIDSVATPRHGTATTVGSGPGGRSVIHYVSTSGFIGSDVVGYTLRNTATNETVIGTITINVLGGPLQALGTLPSRIFDPSYTVLQGETLHADGYRAFNLVGLTFGPANGTTVRLVAGPSHGTLDLNADGAFEYTPAAGFTGVDTFRYEALTTAGVTLNTAVITVVDTAEKLLDGRLRALGIAMRNYEDVHNSFAVVNNPSYFDTSGKPYLSWRVHLLPFLEHGWLYEQFHLDEPWNSVHNLPLAEKMPDFFRSPGATANSNLTRFQIISGEGAPYFWRLSSGRLIGPRASQFTDGLENSILVIESAGDEAVVWTKPDDLEFDPTDPLAALGTMLPDKIHAVMADGETIVLPSSIDPATFTSLVTISGGELVDANRLRREYAEANGGAAAVRSFGEAASIDYLRQIAFAMLQHESVRRSFPVVNSSSSFDEFDEHGNPYLSWRVHILPYLGFKNLYDRFHLDEPWNSEHNLPLLAEMPDLFRSAGDLSNSSSTRLMTLTGPDAPFSRRPAGVDQEGPRLNEFVDGTSNTILFVEASANKTVPWTKPDDLPFDIHNPLAAVGDLLAGEMRAAFADASVRVIPADVSAAEFSALVTPQATKSYLGSVIPEEELRDSGAVTSRESRRRGALPAEQVELTNDFKQIAIAMHNYHDQRQRFPISTYGTGGQPLLSWRVHLLPYLEQQELYEQFHLDEPWDSPHNLALLDQMPSVFRTLADPWDSTTTRVMTFTGPGAPFQPGPGAQGPRLNQFTDGTSNTIMLVDADRANAVPWTKPEDIPFHTNNPYSALGELGPNFIAAFFDGSVRTQLASMSLSQLSAYITRSGGENISNPPTVPNVPGFYVHETGGDTVTNEFGVDAFDVVLDRAPVANVVLELSSSNISVAALDAPTLTFTPQNWNVPQRVALRAVDNHVVNPDQLVDITAAVVDSLSADSYDAVPSQVFSALVRDDDVQPPLLAGDYNRNGVVDAADYTIWQDSNGATGLTPFTGADGNGDGKVDDLDWAVWRTDFGGTVQVRPAVAGDYNVNGVVDAADYTVWRDNLGARGLRYFVGADGTGNGAVSQLDRYVWKSNFGATSSSSAGGAETSFSAMAAAIEPPRVLSGVKTAAHDASAPIEPPTPDFAALSVSPQSAPSFRTLTAAAPQTPAAAASDAALVVLLSLPNEDRPSPEFDSLSRAGIDAAFAEDEETYVCDGEVLEQALGVWR